MSAALIGTISVTGFSTSTTATLNTTGASLLVIHVSYLAGNPPAISDSKGNSWTGLTEATTVVSGACRLFYVANPTVGTGHTFTFTGTGVSGCLIAAAFSGLRLSPDPFDTDATAIGGVSATQVAPGPITTSITDQLVVSGFAWNNNNTAAALNNGFTVTDSIDLLTGTNFGGAFGYKIQATITTYSPEWSNGATGRREAAIAAFIPESGVPESVSDSLTVSDAIGEGRGYAFADSLSFSEAVTSTVSGGGAFVIPELLGDFLNIKDAAATDFVYSPPGGQRGNIDYDQIRRAARSGDGAKLHTLTGSVTTGHGVVFDANGNLIDSGAAPVAAPALVLLEQHTASTSASLVFTTRNATGQSGATIQSDFDNYEIRLINIVPATNNVTFRMQFSTDGGLNYDTGTNYSYTFGNDWINTGNTGGAASQVAIPIDNVGNSSNYSLNGIGQMYNPGGAIYKPVSFDSVLFNAAVSSIIHTRTGGWWLSTSAANAFRFIMSSGDITSGTVRVYGVAK